MYSAGDQDTLYKCMAEPRRTHSPHRSMTGLRQTSECRALHGHSYSPCPSICYAIFVVVAERLPHWRWPRRAGRAVKFLCGGKCVVCTSDGGRRGAQWGPSGLGVDVGWTWCELGPTAAGACLSDKHDAAAVRCAAVATPSSQEHLALTPLRRITDTSG